MTFYPAAYLLTNKIQHYEWGERGQSAYIAQLLGMQVENDTPFAELWMGTHPSGTSELYYQGKQTSLSELVAHYPLEILGRRVASAFKNQFPFLLKVLSANEPLSIQLHPSKEQAAVLHHRDPANYPDANHKPEIAIALERMYALAGLRAARQVDALLQEYPGLRDFVEFKTFSGQPKSRRPKLAFLAMLHNAVEKPDALAKITAQLAAQLKKKERHTYRERLFLEMNTRYPGDVGLLSILFLKLHSLRKGQAMYIPAGVPHAYLKGNIVECMASSDNVIRAGLTPKFKDIPALLDVVNDKSVLLFSPPTADYIYSTPTTEFRIHKFEMKAGQKTTDRNDGVRLLLVLRGRLRLAWQNGTLNAARGQSVLLPGSLNEVGIECLEASEIYAADVP